MTATVPTSDELAIESRTRADADASIMTALGLLGERVAALEADGPLPPPVDPPPAAGIVVNSHASLLSALANREPLIRVKKGLVLKPLNLNTAHGGSQGAPCMVSGEEGLPIPIDLGGVSTRGYALLSYGAHDISFRGIHAFNGSVEQMGLFSIGDGTVPAASKRLTFLDTVADPTITGPATPGSTANATAHFCYVSKAQGMHEDIVFRHSVSQGRGLAAMWHLYADGSGCTRFVADGWSAYGHSQVVMAFAGRFDSATIVNGHAEGCGYVVRAKVGSGIVTARHKGTLVKAIHPDTTAAWNCSGVVAA